MKSFLGLIQLGAICFLLTSCNAGYEEMAQQRIKYAHINQGEIVIAAIQNPARTHYIKGISLAVEEINQKKGLLGRPLKLIIEQSSDDFDTAKSTIRRIVANPKISVVMGHESSAVAIPAAAIYEKSQVLFFPPFVTEEKLTSHGFAYTFRMLPDNKDMAEQISDLASSLKLRKIAVLYAYSDSYRELALLFKQALTNTDLQPVFERSFFADRADFRPLITDLKEQDFDAIFLSGGTKTATNLVQQIREMGVNMPILASSDLNTEVFRTSVGSAGNMTVVPTIYNVQVNNPINKSFIIRYRDKYNQLPDAEAAQGYDSVMLFANKVERAQSTQPALLASTIRYSPPWTGVTGVYLFNKKGDIQGRKYFFRVLNNEKWQMLSAIVPSDAK